MKPRHPSRSRGFTLVELMAVIAVMGVLLTYAVVRIRGAQYNASVYSFAEKINAEIDSMRIRATANGRWQRLVVDQFDLVHEEATFTGMRVPGDDEWQVVRTINAGGELFVSALSTRTHVEPDDSVPGAGTGLGDTIDFAPDGAGQAATIFIGEESDRERARVAIYRATGASYVFDQW